MDLPAGGEPTYWKAGPLASHFGLSPAGSRGQRPWPPGARLRAPTPGLAPGWGPGNANPGDAPKEDRGKSIRQTDREEAQMQDRRRAQRGGRAGTVVAAGALCSTDLLRAPEQSSSTDHSRKAPTAVQRKTSHRQSILEEKPLHHKTIRPKTRQREGEGKSDQINTERSLSPIGSYIYLRMAGCTSRCRQGVLKLIQSLQRLLSGTLTKVSLMKTMGCCFPSVTHCSHACVESKNQEMKSRHDPPYLSPADKTDDELEMTMVCHRPEGLDQLEAQTNFTKQELQILYRGFKNECPSGMVNEETFKHIYSQFFPHGDASMYAHYLFNAFDTTNNGSIKFKDFVMGLSILLRGTLREKLEWTFHLYDINRDGYINREEMTDIVRAIYDMMGKYTYPALKGDVPQQHVDAFFQKMDKNKDGVVTLEEFIMACQEKMTLLTLAYCWLINNSFSSSGCVLEAGKEVVFNPEDDDFEHQLDLRMACVDPSTKDELHMVEVEGQDTEGQKIKAALVSLKPSTLPSVCLGGFTITPPAVFRLKAGSGPIHISGQHLVMMEADQSFGEDDDDDEEEEEEDVKTSKKRPATSPASKSQKKMKMDLDDEDDDDEDDDDEEEEEDEDDEDDEEESEEEETPAKQTPSKQAQAQNGKSPKPTTPAKQVTQNTPKGKGEKSPKTPATPKANLTLPEAKAKILEAVKKGVALPKLQPKFENFVKHGYRVSDAKVQYKFTPLIIILEHESGNLQNSF
ncbi:hypothetical protein L3Q82_022113 [Scortum barcoo]|uniref:Uncharacterized protein n=1 Tax=Scortum barcoo TaxID=214431 RepID=A0ACB8X0B6_9TELE|nr:hypothetical protein L3Q82_022113 [Scortum barcoo]